MITEDNSYSHIPTNELLGLIDEQHFLIRGSVDAVSSRDLVAFDEMRDVLEDRGYRVKEVLEITKNGKNIYE